MEQHVEHLLKTNFTCELFIYLLSFMKIIYIRQIVNKLYIFCKNKHQFDFDFHQSQICIVIQCSRYGRIVNGWVAGGAREHGLCGLLMSVTGDYNSVSGLKMTLARLFRSVTH